MHPIYHIFTDLRRSALLRRGAFSQRRWLAVALILGCAAATVAYVRHHRYKHFAVHDTAMVYRSAWVEADVFRELIPKYKVRTVVNLCWPGEMGDRIVGQRAAVTESGARLIEIPFPRNDTWGIDYQSIDAMAEVFADPEAYPIWIHCQHGRERTVKALAIYDIERRGMSARQSLEAMPLYGMPHPWHTVVFAHNYETAHAAHSPAPPRETARSDSEARRR